MADDKLKILYLMKMLLDETDREHPMNAAEIAEKMNRRYNYTTYNRKTIYADKRGEFWIFCERQGVRSCRAQAHGRCSTVFQVHHKEKIG